MRPAVMLVMSLAWSAFAGDPDLSPQVTEGIVHAPPAELWKVWTTADGYTRLGPAVVDIDFRIGGLIRAAYDPSVKLGDPKTIQNIILAYEPERMMAFRIQRPPAGFPFPTAWKKTWTVATMTDLGDGRTKLRLTMLGYDASDESQKLRAFFERGNAYSLERLQRSFEPADAGK
jgi:uncharacterized protein YndB with AHSA1/START domain